MFYTEADGLSGSLKKWRGIPVSFTGGWANEQVSRNVGILGKLKHSAPRTCLLQVYNSLVLPYLYYCSFICGCNSLNKLNSIIVLQKKAVSIIIAKADFLAYSTPLFTTYQVSLTEDNGYYPNFKLPCLCSSNLLLSNYRLYLIVILHTLVPFIIMLPAAPYLIMLCHLLELK